MANGKINFGKQSGGVLSLTFPDGATNTEVTLPESGTLATTASATESAQGLIELATTAETQAGTDNSRAITPLKLKNSVLGLGQTWQNVTAGRVVGTTYTNTTGKPIYIVIQGHNGGYPFNLQMIINGVTVCSDHRPAGDGNMRFIIDNNSTYKASGFPYIASWFELR